MSGWNSFDSVGAFYNAFFISRSIVLALLIAAGVIAVHYARRWDELVALAERARTRYLPRWRSLDTAALLQNAFAEIAILGTAALLATSYATAQYAARKTELNALAHATSLQKVHTEIDALRRALAERDVRTTNALALRQAMRDAEVRHLAEAAALRREIEQIQARRANVTIDRDTEGRLAAEIETLRRANDQAAARHAVEIAALRQSLQQNEMRRVAVVESLRWEVKQTEAKAETEIGRLQEQLARAERKLASLQATRRLSDDEKNVLINALRPYAGQRVMIAAIAGDADGKAYAEDFVEVFDAAGWQRTALALRHWDRDPVGVEVTLNEADGRAGRINTGVGALINVVRKLSLTDGNTIYLTAEVPSGEVQIKIGKKLPR